MRKLRNLLLILIPSLFLTACALSEGNNEADTTTTAVDPSADDPPTTIVAGTGGLPAPYVTVNESGRPAGYDIEIVEEIFERLPQYELKIELADVTAVLTGVNSGNFDLGVNNYSFNEERAQNYLYSYPYNKITYVFASHKENPVTTLDEAAEKGLTHVGMAGHNNTTVVETYNEDHPENPINIQYYETDLPVLLQEVENNPDKFLLVDYPIYYLNDENYNYQNVVTNPLTDEDSNYIVSTIYAYLLFSKTDEGEHLREQVNEVIREMAEDGTIEAISEKHFGQDQTPEVEHLQETIN